VRLDPTFHDNVRAEDFDILIGIGKAQAALIDQLQTALESGDNEHALEVARELVTLEKKIKLS
jgi:hypothetical protein